MAPTMKRGVHENRHENLHGGRKMKKSFLVQTTVSWLLDSPMETFGWWRAS
jgi:hypothetical protein